MAFWRRINQSKLQLISNQCRRFYCQASYASQNHHARFSVLDKPIGFVDKKCSYFYSNVRFFAAPVQAKKNIKEEANKDGVRLNDQIKANVVRLVTEEGHSIVSFREALEQARKLDLDLVEVQRGDPPVCKIMDYCLERYKRRVKVKDLAKKKSGDALKKTDCKEIRFTEKIEAKDLKMKADTAIRLMERGYRVKCTAMGKGKEDVDENLGGLLSRLTDLLKDVSVMESSPRVERKQAYVVVRHVKYGPMNKSGGKKSKAIEDEEAEPSSESDADRQKSMVPQDDSTDFNSVSENETLSDEDNMPIHAPVKMQNKTFENNKTAWSVSESGDDFDKLFNLSEDISSTHSSKGPHPRQQTTPLPNDHASKFLHPKSVVNPTGSNASPKTSLEVGNRYRKSEPRNQFTPARPTGHMGQNTRESVRLEPPRFPYQGQQPPQNMTASSSAVDIKQVANDASPFRNSRPGSSDLPRQQQSHSDAPVTPSPGFGIFSTPNANSSGVQGHGSNKENRYASNRNLQMGGNDSQKFPRSNFNGSQRQDGNRNGKDAFGIFSNENPNMNANRMPRSN